MLWRIIDQALALLETADAPLWMEIRRGIRAVIHGETPEQSRRGIHMIRAAIRKHTAARIE